MLARTSRAALALIGALALSIPMSVPAAGAHAADRTVAKRWMEISRVDGGFEYRASKHNNNLTITRHEGRVRFADTTARVLRTLPHGCRRAHAATGIAVTCRIPSGTTPADPLLLDIQPGRGADKVDGSALGAEFRLDMNGALGDDDLEGGAGNDRFNGAAGVDTVHGGPGDDFIRVGDGDDVADGGVGNDHVLGTAGNDQLAGSVGDDVLEGGDGNDLLLGGPGSDSLLCGPGDDTSDDSVDEDDLPVHCEHTVP